MWNRKIEIDRIHCRAITDGRATALILIEEVPPIPFQDRLAAYQAAIEDLTRVMLEAAQSPQGITENPQRPA